MYNFMDSSDVVISALYFILLVLFGSFFLINLILAVIMQSFTKFQEKLQEDEDKLKKEEEVTNKYDPGQKERREKAEKD